MVKVLLSIRASSGFPLRGQTGGVSGRMASRAREAERGITVPATAGQAQEYEAAHGVLQRTPQRLARPEF
jgi:hypothetical protein